MSMKSKATLAGFALATLASLPAAAAEGEGKWTLGVSGGTLGIGPELAYRYNTHLGVRLNGGFFSYDRDEELDDIDYNGDLKLNSIGLQADWYPMGGGFRLSLGARSNSNEVKLKATPTQNVEIGDVNYTPAQVGTLNGTVTMDDFAPTLTLGYGGTLGPGFTMGFELGVMFQGSPKIDELRSTGGTLSSNQAFQTQLANERQQMEDDAEDFKYWPVLQLHVLYRF